MLLNAGYDTIPLRAEISAMACKQPRPNGTLDVHVRKVLAGEMVWAPESAATRLFSAIPTRLQSEPTRTQQRRMRELSLTRPTKCVLLSPSRAL